MVLEDHVIKRRANYDFYVSNLIQIINITFLQEPEGYYFNRWLTCILLDNPKDQEGLRVFLEQDNIETRPLWKPMHQQPIFKDAPSYINGVSDDLFERGLCLPSGSNLTADDLERIVSLIIQYFE